MAVRPERYAKLIFVVWIRPHLPWLILSWILLPGGTAFASAVALLASSAAADEMICECPGASPGQQCPMHRHNVSGHGRAPLDRGQCAMRGVQTDVDLALLSFTVSAAMPLGVQALDTPAAAESVAAGSPLLSSRSVYPDLPPPRA